MKTNERIDTLVSQIEDTYSKSVESEKLVLTQMSQTVVFYRDCGKHLTELQKECKKENIKFYPFIEEKFGIKERMAQRYMKLAKNPKTKDVKADFFENMNNPTLTNVLDILSMCDTDFQKVIDGDDTPLEDKKSNPSQNQTSDNTENDEDKTSSKPSDSNDKNESEDVNVDDTNPNNDTDNSPSDTDSEEEEKFVNEYPHLFTDEEYQNILTSTKEVLIQMVILEREKHYLLKDDSFAKLGGNTNNEAYNPSLEEETA